jgi:hypothetical protein
MMPLPEGHWVEVAPKNSESIISLLVPDKKRMSKEVYEVTKSNIGSETGI